MTTEQLTNLKEQIQDALQDGADYPRLREIIDQYYANGCTKTEAYETLQTTWQEYGFDDDEHDKPNRIRDELEFAMEQVWYWDQ